MSHNISLGKIGEDIAVQFLIDKGYEILERNWKAYRREIDIIAIDGKDIVFVEVKTRQTDAFGYPELAVDRKKRVHLFSAASSYYYRHHLSLNYRFDVISIIYNYGNPEITHFIDAFHTI